jgi:hypothetical protein
MSILEGLVKAESTINPNIDMSHKTGDTYNIEKAEIHIGTLIIADRELAKEIAAALLRHQQRPVVETQNNTPAIP